MKNAYLIPANSKRSMLILGLFTPIDLAIFLTGAGLTIILMLSYHAVTMGDVIMILTPLLISTTMVMPVPNHRNIWTLTANIYHYLSNRRTYFWRGWCMTNGEENQIRNK